MVKKGKSNSLWCMIFPDNLFFSRVFSGRQKKVDLMIIADSGTAGGS